MSKALICGVALAALVASGVTLRAADIRIPGFQQGDRDRDRGGDRDRDRGRVDLIYGRQAACRVTSHHHATASLRAGEKPMPQGLIPGRSRENAPGNMGEKIIDFDDEEYTGDKQPAE